MIRPGDYLLSTKNKSDRFRVVLNDPHGPSIGGYLWIYSLSRRAFPKQYSVKEIEGRIKNKQLELIRGDSDRVTQPHGNSDKAKERIRKIWNRIKSLVECGAWRDLMKLPHSARKQKIREAADKAGVSTNRIWMDLCLFFAGGCTRDGLASRQGAIHGRPQMGGAKRGRKRRDGVTGIPVFAALRKKISSFILKLETKGIFADDQFNQINRKFFSAPVIVKGKIDHQLVPEHQRISREQFFNIRHQLHLKGLLLRRRFGPRKYQNEIKGGVGSWKGGVTGPGQVYMLDDSMAQVELVSASNRKRQIGTARFALVVDAYSKRIVGFYLGLDDAKWENVETALYHAFTSKKKIFARFGLTEPCKYAAEGLANYVFMDKAPENTGSSSDGVPDKGIVDVKNARAWIACDKTFVERAIGSFKTRLFMRLPGWRAKGSKRRGAKDPKLDAVLTLHELTELFLEAVIAHNEAELPLDSIPLNARGKGLITPYQLWDYGIEKLTGSLVPANSTKLKQGLLRTNKATVTKRGVIYRGSAFNHAMFIERDLYSKARAKESFKIDVHEDPLDPTVLHHWDKSSRKMLTLKRVSEGADRESFYFADHEAEAANHSQEKTTRRRENYPSTFKRFLRREAVVDEAKQLQASTPGKHVASSNRKIRSARSNEKTRREDHGLGAVPKKDFYKVTRSAPTASSGSSLREERRAKHDAMVRKQLKEVA